MLNCPACGFLYSLLASQCPACHLPRHAALAFGTPAPAPEARPASAWPGLGVWCIQAVVTGIIKCLLLVVSLVAGAGLFMITTLIGQLFSRGQRSGTGLIAPPGFGESTGLGPATDLDGMLGQAMAPSPLPLIRHLFGRLGRDHR